MAILSSVHHEHAILTVFVGTRTGIKNVASNSRFRETSTVSFIFFSCYLNSILEQSSLVVEFFRSWATFV